MIKKILLILVLFLSFFQINIFAEGEIPQHEEPEICGFGSSDKINCSTFTIQTDTFSPGNGDVLSKAQEGGGDTIKSANAILGTIIKNLIIVFGVLSLLMMTIGGGMMIFHSGQESILTRGKGIFVWGIASLAIGLSAGLIVKIVSYVLY